MSIGKKILFIPVYAKKAGHILNKKEGKAVPVIEGCGPSKG